MAVPTTIPISLIIPKIPERWIEKMEERVILDKHLNAPTMQNINDYRKAVQEAYEDARKNGTLKSLLNLPSPENIRAVCLEKLAKGFDRNDIDILCSFFGEASNIDELRNRVLKHEREKFIPISRFLQCDTTRPNITITEIAAWLIDFQLRPFNKFYESPKVSNSEVEDQKDDSQPRHVETNKPDLVEIINEDTTENITGTASQPDFTDPDVNTNSVIVNPQRPDVTEPKTIEQVLHMIGRRMMRVAAVFFCLYVMTTFFKSQQERGPGPIVQTQQTPIPEKKQDPKVIRERIPATKTSVLKETNKRCQSLTLKGKQCKRNATKGDYCWQHPLE